MPRPRILWSEETAAIVSANASRGVSQDLIAMMVGISEPTLRRLYRKELDVSRAKALAEVVGALWRSAVEENNPAAQIFICKTQLGWKETQKIEQTTQIAEKVIVRMPENGRRY